MLKNILDIKKIVMSEEALEISLTEFENQMSSYQRIGRCLYVCSICMQQIFNGRVKQHFDRVHPNQPLPDLSKLRDETSLKYPELAKKFMDAKQKIVSIQKRCEINKPLMKRPRTKKTFRASRCVKCLKMVLQMPHHLKYYHGVIGDVERKALLKECLKVTFDEENLSKENKVHIYLPRKQDTEDHLILKDATLTMFYKWLQEVWGGSCREEDSRVQCRRLARFISDAGLTSVSQLIRNSDPADEIVGEWLEKSPSSLIVLLNTLEYLTICISDSNVHFLDKRRAQQLRDRIKLWRKNTSNPIKRKSHQRRELDAIRVPDLCVVESLVSKMKKDVFSIIAKQAEITTQDALILRRFCMLCPIVSGHRAACAWAVRMCEWTNRKEMVGKHDNIIYQCVKVYYHKTDTTYGDARVFLAPDEYSAWLCYAKYGRAILLNGKKGPFVAAIREKNAVLNIMKKNVDDQFGEEAFFVTSGGKCVQLQYDLDIITSAANLPKITSTLLRKAIATANQLREATATEKEQMANSICHRSATQQSIYKTILTDTANLESNIEARNFITPSTKVLPQNSLGWLCCTTSSEVFKAEDMLTHMSTCTDCNVRKCGHGPSQSCTALSCIICVKTKSLVPSEQPVARPLRQCKVAAQNIIKLTATQHNVDLDEKMIENADLFSEYDPINDAEDKSCISDSIAPLIQRVSARIGSSNKQPKKIRLAATLALSTSKDVHVRSWLEDNVEQEPSDSLASTTSDSLSSVRRKPWSHTVLRLLVTAVKHTLASGNVPPPADCERLRQLIPSLQDRKAQTIYIKLRQIIKDDIWKEYL